MLYKKSPEELKSILQEQFKRTFHKWQEREKSVWIPKRYILKDIK